MASTARLSKYKGNAAAVRNRNSFWIDAIVKHKCTPAQTEYRVLPTPCNLGSIRQSRIEKLLGHPRGTSYLGGDGSNYDSGERGVVSVLERNLLHLMRGAEHRKGVADLIAAQVLAIRRH